jgi:hypothetical protein
MQSSLLDIIEDQLVANRLELAGVTIAATPFANTPVVLSLHWHGFVETKLAPDSGAVALQPVPSSALQVNTRWDSVEELERDALESAWELGAWDIARREIRPHMRPGADPQELIDCMTAFGIPPHHIDGEPVVVSDVQDAHDLVDAAAQAGYVRWQFRPVWCGMWRDVTRDATLEEGGYRNPTCPLAVQTYVPGRNGSLVYRLGKDPGHPG